MLRLEMKHGNSSNEIKNKEIKPLRDGLRLRFESDFLLAFEDNLKLISSLIESE